MRKGRRPHCKSPQGPLGYQILIVSGGPSRGCENTGKANEINLIRHFRGDSSRTENYSENLREFWGRVGQEEVTEEKRAEKIEEGKERGKEVKK